MARRPRTIFIGTGAFAVPPLRALIDRPDLVDLVGVVTAPPRPAGRGGRLRRSPVHEAAAAAGIAPILTPERLRAPDAVADVLDLSPDLIVLADYGQIVPAALLAPPFGALNLHPSLLPRHRGATPVPAAILAGDERTGVTLMQMDAGLDTGPIVAAREVPLTGIETAPELEARLAELGAELLIETVGPWIRREVEARPQAADGATLTRPLRRSDGQLDSARAAAELARQVRAYQPWPGSWLETAAGRLVVWAARPAPGPAVGGAPGRLVPVGDGLALVTVDGILELLDVQPAGGRHMSGAELVRGRPGILDG